MYIVEIVFGGILAIWNLSKEDVKSLAVLALNDLKRVSTINEILDYMNSKYNVSFTRQYISKLLRELERQGVVHMVRKNMLQVVLGKHVSKSTTEILEKLKNVHGRSNIIILNIDNRETYEYLERARKIVKIIMESGTILEKLVKNI